MINGKDHQELTGVIMTEDGPVPVGQTENERLLIAMINDHTETIQRMNTLLDHADQILRRNNERIEKVRREFGWMLAACATVGFGLGISLMRLLELWR